VTDFVEMPQLLTLREAVDTFPDSTQLKRNGTNEVSTVAQLLTLVDDEERAYEVGVQDDREAIFRRVGAPKDELIFIEI
jgi:hypothetical protein